jgi:mannitol repressor
MAMSLMAESDRGCIVLATAMLHQALGNLLAVTFVDERSAKALIRDAMAPLRTLSAQIHLAYALGLIPKEMRDDIDMIRRIRNEAAHGFSEHFKPETDGFRNHRVKQRCRQFHFFRSIKPAPESRMAFIMLSGYLTSTFEGFVDGLRKAFAASHPHRPRRLAVSDDYIAEARRWVASPRYRFLLARRPKVAAIKDETRPRKHGRAVHSDKDD